MGAWHRLLDVVPQMTLDEARPFLLHLARDRRFLATAVWPYVASTVASGEPTIVATYGTREATTCLQVFVWPAGAATPIHDHTAWGAYQCVVGTLLECRYARVDDGRAPATARLREQWRRLWRPDDGASTLAAYDAGIHKVANLGAALAVSLHMYGPRAGLVDGRDYDPRRSYVCDRIEGMPPTGGV